ncbi:hypothetical protein EVAR_18685_1 [Eumeta japonica]|uniref:Uncharacterized protein n=1 Tax=Eumeta variegata TaxID=151549 RepID=A0A4C1U7Y9_EUMVA|nr:hypothetical protein EVAR_18685_1 [Eumeta japonica]
MGTNSSKPTTNEEIDNPDPRSPSPEIVRTPLQDKTGVKQNITKIMDLTKTLDEATINKEIDEEIINNNPILAAVIKNHLQSYDPRSPTQDFDRTPIIIASKIIENQKVLQDITENLDTQNQNGCQYTENLNDQHLSSEIVVPKNLCNGFFDMSLDDSAKDIHVSFNSSNISEDKRQPEKHTEIVLHNVSGLLETNFEYHEDTENVDEYEDSKEMQNENESTSKYQIVEILKNDPRSPSEGIERTPIVVTKTEIAAAKNVEEMSDETLIGVLQNTNTKFRQTLIKPQKPNKDTESLLIYEDESENKTNEILRKPSSAHSTGSRTPLSCMKNKTGTSQIRSKSENTINGSGDKATASRIPKRISHIPRLTSLSKLQYRESNVSLKNASKILSVSGDCENTPPHSHRDCWDKEKSIVL